MQVKVIIRIFKLFYSQAMIHNICYFNQKINELRGQTAKDASKYLQKLNTLIKKRQETIERDGWKLSDSEVLAIATTINNMKDDTTESSATKHAILSINFKNLTSLDQFAAILRLHKGMQKSDFTRNNRNRDRSRRNRDNRG
eukprot:g12589.t1